MEINNTNCCDKCGRSLDGRGWLEINGWKICGICQWEKEHRPAWPFNKGSDYNPYDLNAHGGWRKKIND